MLRNLGRAGIQLPTPLIIQCSLLVAPHTAVLNGSILLANTGLEEYQACVSAWGNILGGTSSNKWKLRGYICVYGY